MTPVLLAAALAVGAPALKDKPPAGPALVGRWACMKLLWEGRGDEVLGRGLEYEFTPDGQWLVYQHGWAHAEEARTYRPDPEAGPAAADFAEAGATYRGVFRVEGDTLTLSWSAGADRPATSQTTGKGLMTFTFRRVKDAK